MSLILDALRKSEAERRRGQAPGLHTGMPMPAAPRASAWRHAPIVAGGVLVLVAVALLLARGQPAGDAREAPAATDAAKATAGDGAPPLDDAVGEAQPPPAAPGAAAPASAPLPGAAATARHGTEPTKAPASADLRAAIPALPVPPLPRTAAAATQAPVVGPGSPATAIAPSAPAAPVPTAASDEVEDPLPTLAILPPGERATLPALKLSMHVWNETPARRFAIVDGQRIVEGAQLGGAVVTQIRRDGVELDVNGRRVLLPRP